MLYTNNTVRIQAKRAEESRRGFGVGPFGGVGMRGVRDNIA